MDFIVGLPWTFQKYDAVWIIVDRLTKSAHFLPVQTSDSLNKLASLYVAEIVRLHGVPVSIISDRDPRFTSKFWESLQKAMGTKLKFSFSQNHTNKNHSIWRRIERDIDLFLIILLNKNSIASLA